VSVSAAEDFAQYKLQFVDYIQHDYEVIRPIVLFAETIAERSRQTGIERSSVGDKARRFVMEGMLGLVEQRVGQAGRKGHVYPEAVAAYMLYVKQLYPPIHDREVVRILQRKFGYHTNHHTVHRFFARHALPVQLELQMPVFTAFTEAYQARWTVVRMWYEGWNKQSIAGCLQLSRTHVYTILEAFARDGFAGLEEQRTRPPQHPGNQLTLPFLKEVLDIQREYPRAGRFRVHGLLEIRREEAPPSEATVGRAMALNRQFHGAPGPWASAQDEAPSDTTPKHLPYRPRYRHHMWFIDIRYLVRLDGGWVYSLCMLEGYSRKILAGMASPHQDLTAVLQLLFAALAEYGCPAMVISDHGAVFRAHDYTEILRALEIEPTYIELRKPWQNLIEAQFKVQLRLADFKFEHAQTLEEIQALHAAFIETFNTTRHWAHQHRDDGRRTPVEVLEWVRGRSVERAYLHQLFGAVQFLRTVNRYGFISVQRFYLYAEQGLSRQRVAIWIYEGELRLEYQETLLARYRCTYDQRQRRLRDVSDPIVYPTIFASPQLELLELDATQWIKVQQRVAHHRMRRVLQLPEQLPLIHVGSVALLWSYMFFEGVGKNFFPHVSTVR
jgi:transposase InsO family protein/transposase